MCEIVEVMGLIGGISEEVNWLICKKGFSLIGESVYFLLFCATICVDYIHI